MQQKCAQPHTRTPAEPCGANCAITRVLEKKQKRSTGPSRVVPHRSTTPARTSLTSLFGWEAVSLVDMAALTVLRNITVHIELYATTQCSVLFLSNAGSESGRTWSRHLLHIRAAADCLAAWRIAWKRPCSESDTDGALGLLPDQHSQRSRLRWMQPTRQKLLRKLPGRRFLALLLPGRFGCVGWSADA